jgi:hypothetical protein
MKTFKDLRFKSKKIPKPFDGSQAVLNFENNYGISVINGFGAYCGKNTFEVAILFNGDLCYDTEITNDVLPYQTEENITDIMIKLQSL